MAKKRKKKRNMDHATLNAATTSTNSTGNMSIPTGPHKVVGMKKGGLCKGMGAAKRGGKFNRNG